MSGNHCPSVLSLLFHGPFCRGPSSAKLKAATLANRFAAHFREDLRPTSFTTLHADAPAVERFAQEHFYQCS